LFAHKGFWGGGGGAIAANILTSALDGAFHSGCFTPGKRVFILIEVEEEGGWNPRASVDTLEKRKFSFPCQELKRDAMVGHPVA